MDPLLAGLAVVLVLPVAAMATTYLLRCLQTQERLRAMEKGLPVAFDPRDVAWRTRRSAIVLIAAGLGLAAGTCILAAVMNDSETFAWLALAVLPLAVGLGLLFDYRLQARNLDNTDQSGGTR